MRGFRGLSPVRRVLLLEAALALIAARLLLHAVQFRRLTGLMNYPLGDGKPSESERALMRNDISLVIGLAAAHLPGETACFPRAMTAQFMCRRRGIDARMSYGAAVVGGTGLTAHVWVEDGSADVVGCEDLSRFRVLARFPA